MSLTAAMSQSTQLTLGTFGPVRQHVLKVPITGSQFIDPFVGAFFFNLACLLYKQ